MSQSKYYSGLGWYFGTRNPKLYDPYIQYYCTVWFYEILGVLISILKEAVKQDSTKHTTGLYICLQYNYTDDIYRMSGLVAAQVWGGMHSLGPSWPLRCLFLMRILSQRHHPQSNRIVCRLMESLILEPYGCVCVCVSVCVCVWLCVHDSVSVFMVLLSWMYCSIVCIHVSQIHTCAI